MSDQQDKKLWGGRFQEATDRDVESFSASEQFDRRLYRQDIQGSMAHARMLAAQGIISQEDARQICEGLQEIEQEIREGRFQWRPDLEDVHMNIEKTLSDRIGAAGKRLHTARSRNDQVATDVRIYCRDEIVAIDQHLLQMQKALLYQAENGIDILMPGFTHLQHAQPVLWAHHMLAYFEMFKRDRLRLRDCHARLNISPLGSAALAGTGFPVDRMATARELGFSGITANSLDAVSDRDFLIELLSALSIVMMHLSRLSEELIIWSTSEFSFVELPDGYCTGSSIMPQKKNPDVPELVRGKTGRVYGDLMAMLTIMKGLPLAYNRDMQEDKEALFDAVDTTRDSLKVMAGLVRHMKPLADNLRQAVYTGFITATDLADYLVTKGVPFREAHEIVGNVVARCLAMGKELHDLDLQELQDLHPAIQEDLLHLLTPEGSVNSRRCPGGTGPEPVRGALEQARRWISDYSLQEDERS